MSNESITVYTPKDQQGELSASDNSEFSRISKETRQTQTYSVITTDILKYVCDLYCHHMHPDWLEKCSQALDYDCVFYCIKTKTVFTVRNNRIFEG